MHCLAAWRLCSLWPVQTKKSPQGTRARPREPTCPPAISGAMDHLRGSPGRWTISGDHLGGDASAGAVVRGLQEAIGCSAAHATAFLDNAQAPGELDRCVAAAGLRYFEVQRLERLLPWALREAARGREGETVALSTLYPQPQAGQSVAGFLDQHQLSQYASALEAKGLQWGDLPFMSFEVLSAAGLKKFHALRMLRKLPPRPTTHPPPPPASPPPAQDLRTQTSEPVPASPEAYDLHSSPSTPVLAAAAAMSRREGSERPHRRHRRPSMPTPPQADDGYRTCIDREYVQKEMGWAKGAGKHFITVFEDDRRRQGFFDYGEAWSKYDGTDWQFLLEIDATCYRRDAFEARAMIDKIFSKSVTRPTGASTAQQPRPINPPGHWDYFLSHGQAGAGDQVMALSMHLKARGKRVWYDMDMQDRSEAAMREGVMHCDNFIVFLSGDPLAVGGSETAEQEWEQNFEIHEVLGRGSSSVVFRATDRRHHRAVALKVYRPAQHPEAPFSEAEFRQLSRAAIAASHTANIYIANCFDHLMWSDRQQFQQSLELVSGPSLQRVLDEEGPMHWFAAGELMGMVLEGLQSVHEQKLVHRDVTLSNVLLSRDRSTPKLIVSDITAPCISAPRPAGWPQRLPVWPSRNAPPPHQRTRAHARTRARTQGFDLARADSSSDRGELSTLFLTSKTEGAVGSSHECHLRVITITIGALAWLRFTYVLRCRY
jgi:hypothetical protein